MIELIEEWFRDSGDTLRRFRETEGEKVAQAARMIASAFSQGGKILIFGNGGSAADAQHLAAEFVNRFRIERPPLPALALTTDSSVLTSVGNDYSFDEIFAKQIKALGQAGDVALAISTSGRSANVLAGVREAREKGMAAIGLTGGQEESPLAREVDLAIVVPSEDTPRIQEVHLVVEHLLCGLVDTLLFIAPGEENV